MIRAVVAAVVLALAACSTGEPQTVTVTERVTERVTDTAELDQRGFDLDQRERQLDARERQLDRRERRLSAAAAAIVTPSDDPPDPPPPTDMAAIAERVQRESWERLSPSDREGLCTAYRIDPDATLDAWIDAGGDVPGLPNAVLRRLTRERFEREC